MKRYNNKNRLPGFTLVELSIVLVIIGLIVGGVLAGQSLIISAQLRAQVTQLNQFSAALNTFYTKFEAVPGDWNNIPAVGGYLTRAHTIGQGNGNGIIESSCAAGAGVFAIGEGELFWADLSAAGLVNFTSAYADGTCAAAETSLVSLLPPASYKHGNMVAAFSNAGLNYYFIAALTDADATGVFAGGATTPGILPADAYAIDLKIDDGTPGTGSVKAAGGTPTDAALSGSSVTAGKCVNTSATPNAYNPLNKTYVCALQVQMQ